MLETQEGLMQNCKSSWQQPLLRSSVFGNEILGYTLQDMTLDYDTTFSSGSLQSDRALTFHNGTMFYFHEEHILGMVDRFGNTIRFEYDVIPLFGDSRLLTRIIDSGDLFINFQYRVTGNTRTVTVVSPDSSTFVISLSGIPGHDGLFQLDRVRNQVGAETVFTYDVREAYFDAFTKTPVESNHALLLTQVTYPSGAQVRFEYTRHGSNLGARGSRHVWRVSQRTFVNNNWPYHRTDFVYRNDSTGFPLFVEHPPANHTFSTSVIQNNGLRTVYNFNYRQLNTIQWLYNGNTLISQQETRFNNDRLPNFVELTEHFNSFTRTTEQRFVYNEFGQVTETVSPLARGSSNARYRTITTYDERFGLPLTTTFMPDAQTTVQERNTLSADGRSITSTAVYENNTRQSRTDFLHDSYGNVTEMRQFPNSNGNNFITTQITFSRGTLPSLIQTIGVADANDNLINERGAIEHRFTYDAMWRIVTETDPNGVRPDRV